MKPVYVTLRVSGNGAPWKLGWGQSPAMTSWLVLAAGAMKNPPDPLSLSEALNAIRAPSADWLAAFTRAWIASNRASAPPGCG